MLLTLSMAAPTGPKEKPKYIAILKGDADSVLAADVSHETFSFDFGEETVRAVLVDEGALSDSSVEMLEPNYPVKLYGCAETVSEGISDSWVFQLVCLATYSKGLDRLDQKKLPLDNKYTYDVNSGSNVTVYILDTGINPDLKEFQGRASMTGFTGDDVVNSRLP
jgi:hypothetical protein